MELNINCENDGVLAVYACVLRIVAYHGNRRGTQKTTSRYVYDK